MTSRAEAARHLQRSFSQDGEDHGFDIADCSRSPVFRLLTAQSYRLRCHMLFSSVYVNEAALKRPA